jgi:hypothetical protein
MSKKIWQQSNNFFIRIAENNMSKFYSLSNRVMLNLESHLSDPVVESIHHDAVSDKTELDLLYSSKHSNKSNRKGNIISFSNKMNELKDEKLPLWEAILLQKYPVNTAEYSIILPKGRTGINRGKAEDRIFNLKEMKKEIKNYPSLDALYLEMSTFLDELELLYKSKEIRKSDVNYVSSDLKLAANKMAVRLFIIKGLLSAHYASTPEFLTNFFPVSYFRNKKKSNTENQNSMKINLATNEILEAGIGFTLNTIFLISLLEGSTAKLWFSHTKDMVIPATTIEINEYEEVEIEVKAHAGTDDRFMMIANTSANEKAVVEITLLDNVS